MDQNLAQSLILVRAAQAGDADALNQLFQRYYEPVRTIVRARMGVRVRRAMDSGDILQNTFMTAAKIFERFEGHDESSLINWLAKIAQRQITDAADHLGAQKRDIGRAVPLDSSPDLHPAAPTRGPLDRLAAHERDEVLATALQGMSEEHRELILQHDIARASWEDIAVQLGKPSPDAARMAYGTAKAKLARRLLELGYEDTIMGLERDAAGG